MSVILIKSWLQRVQQRLQQVAVTIKEGSLTFEQDINISDWENPWTFYNMFIESDSIWINWLKQQGLLASSMLCRANVGSDGKHPVLCNKPCKFAVRNKVIDGYVWRCTGKERHETSIRHNSFFNNSKHRIPDILNFVKNFLDGHVLRKCAQFTNISYKSTSVNWANFCRDLFVQYVWEKVVLEELKLEGEIEVDESLFGHKCKYHRGKLKSRIAVWVVGLVERGTGKIILYPVEKRDSATLESIITRHVKPGSTIFTDGWSAYRRLNFLGYRHFSVIHKETYKSVYRNVNDPNELVSVDTNLIEGSWQHVKQHFKRINGTSLSNFEAHICEIIWRNDHKGSPGRVYEHYFALICDIFLLSRPPRLTGPRPVFDTWTDDCIQPEGTEFKLYFASSQSEPVIADPQLDPDIIPPTLPEPESPDNPPKKLHISFTPPVASVGRVLVPDTPEDIAVTPDMSSGVSVTDYAAAIPATQHHQPVPQTSASGKRTQVGLRKGCHACMPAGYELVPKECKNKRKKKDKTAQSKKSKREKGTKRKKSTKRTKRKDANTRSY